MTEKLALICGNGTDTAIAVIEVEKLEWRSIKSHGIATDFRPGELFELSINREDGSAFLYWPPISLETAWWKPWTWWPGKSVACNWMPLPKPPEG